MNGAEKFDLAALEVAARECCATILVDRDYHGQVAGTLVTDSGGTARRAEMLWQLAEGGRFRVVAASGRMVVGYWPENDPQKQPPNPRAITA